MKPLSILLYYIFVSVIESIQNNIISDHYIIGFNQPSNTAFIDSFKKEFQHVNLIIKDSYEHELIHGLHVEIKYDSLHSMNSALSYITHHPSVKYVEPLTVMSAASVDEPQFIDGDNLDYSLLNPNHLTQVDKVYEEYNNKGEGVLICVLDRGVDYLHPALGGGFGQGYKISVGYDLVGDDYTGKNDPVPDDDPIDSCSQKSTGHGTLVSGIIAGYDKSQNFSGVAPNANMGHFRVFGCQGTTTDTVITNALLMSYDAGCDIINLSLVEYRTYTSSMNYELIEKLAQKGVIVVASAGNGGELGYQTTGTPSIHKDALSIASVENDYEFVPIFTATGLDKDIIYSDEELGFIEGPVALGDENIGSGNDACNLDTIPSSVQNKIGIVQRGNCTFDEKVANLAEKGAVGMILYNDEDSRLALIIDNSPIPYTAISLEDGMAMVKAIKKTSVNISNLRYTLIPNTLRRTVSPYSSIGPDAELTLKPNVAAVTSIYSTVPQSLGSYKVFAGTSASTAYMSGVSALYLSIKGRNHSVSFIREQLQNSASPVYLYNSTIIDSPLRQGAGLVQLYDALTQTSHVTPATLSFNDTTTADYLTQTINITNHGCHPVRYRIRDYSTIAIEPFDNLEAEKIPLFVPLNSNVSASLTFSKTGFRLMPGKSCTVTVTVTPPDTDPRDHILYGGFIEVESRENRTRKVIHIPYFGSVGSQKELPVFSPGFPLVVNGTDSMEFPNRRIDSNSTSQIFPLVVVSQLIGNSPLLRFELKDLQTKTVIGRFLPDQPRVSRNFIDTDTTFTEYMWDGTLFNEDTDTNTTIPDGEYAFILSALKMFGNPDVPQDWERVELENTIRITN